MKWYNPILTPDSLWLDWADTDRQLREGYLHWVYMVSSFYKLLFCRIVFSQMWLYYACNVPPKVQGRKKPLPQSYNIYVCLIGNSNIHLQFSYQIQTSYETLQWPHTSIDLYLPKAYPCMHCLAHYTIWRQNVLQNIKI